MKDIKELRKELGNVFKSVKAGEMDIDQAKTLVSTANSIISSCYVELEHNKFVGSYDSVDFLKPEASKKITE